MHRIFGQNKVTFELGRCCLFNGKVYSHETLIHSYINHLAIQLSNISWIYSIATEQWAPKNYDHQNRVHQIFGQHLSNIWTKYHKWLIFNYCKNYLVVLFSWLLTSISLSWKAFWTRNNLRISVELRTLISVMPPFLKTSHEVYSCWLVMLHSIIRVDVVGKLYLCYF